MLFLLGVVVLIFMLARESSQRRDAENFSKWMKNNAPNRYVRNDEMKHYINQYNNSKHR
jgi:hypothetical protein